MPEIKNISDPRIDNYRTLRYTPRNHSDGGLFITEGEKVTIKLLKSGFEIISIFAIPEYFKKYAELFSNCNIPAEMRFTADKKLMEEIVGFRLHNGIMAMAKQPADVPPDKMSSPIVVLNGINNAENVGAIVRNCATFGIKSLIVDENSSSPYLRRSVRVSMGGILELDVYHSPNIIEDLRTLTPGQGYSIISAEITPDSISIKSFKFPEKFILVFGNEGHGVQKELLEDSDSIIHIPMAAKADSLNVAASTAIFLYEIF